MKIVMNQEMGVWSVVDRAGHILYLTIDRDDAREWMVCHRMAR